MTRDGGLKSKQLIGLVGAVVALLTLCFWFSVARRLLVGIAIPADEPAERLAYAAHWLLLPGGTLLVGVWVAARRGFLANAIDGTRNPSSRSLEINLRYNQNTVEQVVLVAISWAALAITLPIQQLFLIPAMAVTFAVGRIAFWIGYLIHPMGRAFGMVMTILPTIAAYGWLGWHAWLKV